MPEPQHDFQPLAGAYEVKGRLAPEPSPAPSWTFVQEKLVPLEQTVDQAKSVEQSDVPVDLESADELEKITEVAHYVHEQVDYFVEATEAETEQKTVLNHADAGLYAAPSVEITMDVRTGEHHQPDFQAAGAAMVLEAALIGAVIIKNGLESLRDIGTAVADKWAEGRLKHMETVETSTLPELPKLPQDRMQPEKSSAEEKGSSALQYENLTCGNTSDKEEPSLFELPVSVPQAQTAPHFSYINLPRYAETERGYTASPRGDGKFLLEKDGEQLRATQANDGTWSYTNPRNPNDKGDILAFTANRRTDSAQGAEAAVSDYLQRNPTRRPPDRPTPEANVPDNFRSVTKDKGADPTDF